MRKCGRRLLLIKKCNLSDMIMKYRLSNTGFDAMEGLTGVKSDEDLKHWRLLGVQSATYLLSNGVFKCQGSYCQFHLMLQNVNKLCSLATWLNFDKHNSHVTNERRSVVFKRSEPDSWRGHEGHGSMRRLLQASVPKAKHGVHITLFSYRVRHTARLS